MKPIRTALSLLLLTVLSVTSATLPASAAEPADPDFTATVTYTSVSGMFGSSVEYVFESDGVIEDEGAVTTYTAYDENGEPLGQVWKLQGEHGTLHFLDLGSQVVSDEYWGDIQGRTSNRTTVSEGEFIILSGTEDYETFVGAGSYVKTYELQYVPVRWWYYILYQPTIEVVTEFEGFLVP